MIKLQDAFTHMYSYKNYLRVVGPPIADLFGG
jgi:hypothetical protein